MWPINCNLLHFSIYEQNKIVIIVCQNVRTDLVIFHSRTRDRVCVSVSVGTERWFLFLRPYGLYKCWWVECIVLLLLLPAFLQHSLFLCSKRKKRDSETKIKPDLKYCIPCNVCNCLLELIKTNVQGSDRILNYGVIHS